MANLFTRLKDSITADLHEALDQKEQKNPVAMLNQYLRESEKETEKVRKLVERQHQLKGEFTREYQQAVEMAEKRRRQAEIAAQAGETSMHEFAVKEQQEYEGRAEKLKAARSESMEQLEALERKYEEMKHKLKDMHLKRMEFMGRENTARAHHKMNRVLDDGSDKSYSRFSEINRYIEDLEDKVNSAYYRNTFDSRMAEIEKKVEHKQEVSG
ncbi:PspA/IM30 family protein [Halobacillus litoralis]|uniref:PspA/IM30 family protein n=1 Tax=Halobacillus litoralis TaxID=45668 RepID=A0A845DV49_9BACI|nr:MULTISPECIES: PspA/IM30 family protein [Halobacillus]MYL20375.1 PspA/IM30 family protein [Halobacillus litoralis]MYL29469.1 PspA/IM30 family protein [Halobacillus halophilus]MYL36686.1 PspA/IM30 family protein [Halobacillus litoralis]